MCDVMPLYFCVALLMYLFVLFVACLTVFVNYLVKQFAMCLMWVEVLCWIDRVWSSTEYECCACDPSVHLSVPSICFVCVFVCWKLSPHLRVCQLDHMCWLSLSCFFG